MEERRNKPMGNKFMSKVLAVFVATALLMTSAIGVFAAGSTDSPQQGAKPTDKTPGVSQLTGSAGHYGEGTMDITYTAASDAETYDINVNGKVVKKDVKGTAVTLTGLAKNGLYDIQIQAKNKSKTGAKSALAAKSLSKRWMKNITKVKVKKGKKKFTVKWKKVKGATGYQICYSKDGKTWKTKFIKGGKKQKATIKKLKKGKYKVFVRAVKGDYLGIRCPNKTVKVK